MRAAVLTLSAALVATGAAATNLFVGVSGTGTACTQASPCTLATAIAQATNGDTVYVAAGTYTGTGEQVVALGKSITLQGGWDGAGGGAVEVDPTANLTTLDGQHARRVITATSCNPVIRGLSIRRGNATGLTAGCTLAFGYAAGCGGGILTVNSVPTIEGNHIMDNVASTLTPDGKMGVGGGVAIIYNNPIIRNNIIRSNRASMDGQGEGGGVAVTNGAPGTMIEDNEISYNTASGSGAGRGGGMFLIYGQAIVRGNVIEGNIGSAVSPEGWGAGLSVERGSHNVESNLIVGNRGDRAAYVEQAGGGQFTANRVIANLGMTALSVAGGESATYPIVNNFISDGTAINVSLIGWDGNPLVADVRHNTIVGNGANLGVEAGANTKVSMVNNIVAWHATGITDASALEGNVTGTLFWNNNDDGVRGTAAIDGNPDFVERLMRDYHIRVGSSAIDGGAATAVATNWDIDSTTRPATATLRDIGADELPPTRFDFGTAGSPVAAGYTRVTEADRRDWYNGWGWAGGSQASRDRGIGTDLNRDLNLTRIGVFSVNLPKGIYDVTVTLGDASFAHDQMLVRLEGVAVDTLSTAKGQFVTKTWRTLHSDEDLDIAFEDMGGADPNVVVNAIEVRNPTIVKVDLGTATSPLAPSYVRATNATTYSAATGMGWVSGTVGCRDRGGADPLKRDLCYSTDATFRLGLLPDGNYEVLLTTGDAAYAHDQMELRVGGAYRWVTSAAGEFQRFPYWVGTGGSVLDIGMKDVGGTDPNAVLNAIEVEPLQAVKFDFGTATSPVAQGYRRASPTDIYEPRAGFGWFIGTVGARDRANSNELMRDLNFTPKGTFVVDLPRGYYYVSVGLGDSRYAHDNMKVTVEGVVLGTYSTAPFQFISADTPTTIPVEDGQLTVELEDLGGTDPNVAIVYLVVQ